MDNEKLGLGLFVGLIVGGIFVIALQGSSCDRACWALASGDKGWIELALSTGTLLGVLLGGWLAWRSYLMNLGTTQATKFQKGVELIASDNRAVVRGGIALLRGIAEDPAAVAYRLPIAQAFLAAASEKDRDMKTKLNVFDRTETEPRYAGNWDRSNDVSMWCLTEAARVVAVIPYNGRIQLLRGSLINVEDIYMTAKILVGHDYSGIHITRSYLSGVAFDHCLFGGSVFECCINQQISFTACNLTNVDMCFVDASGAQIGPDRIATFVLPRDSLIAGLRVWHTPLA